MNERERLKELLEQKSCAFVPCENECHGCHNVEMYDDQIEALADYLLANGVLCPSCKVGDTVYINGCFGGVAEPHKINFMTVRISKFKTAIFFEADLLDEDGNPTGSDCSFWDHYIGESVFLSREEAEKKLAERTDTDGKAD